LIVLLSIAGAAIVGVLFYILCIRQNRLSKVESDQEVKDISVYMRKTPESRAENELAPPLPKNHLNNLTQDGADQSVRPLTSNDMTKEAVVEKNNDEENVGASADEEPAKK
jgi:hypothetical protein